MHGLANNQISSLGHAGQPSRPGKRGSRSGGVVRRFITVRFVGIVLAGLLAASCGGGSAPTYSVGGTVSGLTGSGLVLMDSSGDQLAVSSNGVFTIATAVALGAAYNVSVTTQPQNPLQNCVVHDGSGTVGSAAVKSVSVVCTTVPYTLGGVVSGLAGNGLVLQNNGSDDLPVSAMGPFAFTPAIVPGTAYDVTVLAQPTDPSQSCNVVNGSGTGKMIGSDVSSIAVVCTSSFSNSAVEGTYRVAAYNGAGQIASLSTLTFDGSGHVSGSEVQNSAGTILSAAVSGTYTVAPSSSVSDGPITEGSIRVSSSQATLINTGLTVSLTGVPALTGNVSADGNTIVLSQLTTGQNPGLVVGIKQGQGVFTNKNLAGTFAVVSYGSSADVGSVATVNFDGAGNFSGSEVQNNGGVISDPAVSGTYAIAADGTLAMTLAGEAPLSGGLSADGNALVLIQTTPGQSPSLTVGVKQGQGNSDVADLNDCYAVTSYGSSGDDGGLWTLRFNGSGGVNGSTLQNSAGVISSGSDAFGTYTVSADGALTASPASVGLSFTGGISAGGTTLVTGQITAGQKASIQVAVPVNAVTLIPSSIFFPSCGPPGPKCNNPPSPDMVLGNTGMATLYVFGISIGGNNPGQFSETNNCPATLAPGEFCTIQVGYHENVFTPKGYYSAEIIASVNTVSNAQTAVSVQALAEFEKTQ